MDYMSAGVSNTKCVVATCNLNQWALDFDGNEERIMESIRRAKAAGARYRLGPELEICGYSCEDHFRELDTFLHSEQTLANILESDVTMDILCDIGIPIMHNGVSYNCRVFVLDKKILLIRPKAYLANDGNYHEHRFFRAWKGKPGYTEEHYMPEVLRRVTGQQKVPIGMGVVQTKETKIASEVCEELWVPSSPHITYALLGVEIFSNGSGSHHQLRKLDARMQLMNSATTKCGGCYMYANQQGCDGTRLYFDGSSMVNVNGQIVAQASQFSLRDVEVVTACVDLDDIRSYRAGITSMQEQAALLMAETPSPFAVIDVSHFSLCREREPATPSQPIQVRLHTPEEECALGPACWLWDYLRRSGAGGFLLPLSGGADSASVASIVRVMCDLAAQAVLEEEEGEEEGGEAAVLADVLHLTAGVNLAVNQEREAHRSWLRVQDNSNTDDSNCSSSNSSSSSSSSWNHTGWSQNMPSRRSPACKKMSDLLCHSILHSVYMATENSSQSTKQRAGRLAAGINSYHSSIIIDSIVNAVLGVFKTVKTVHGAAAVPRFKVQGGCQQEDIALQNIQARLRMVMAYLCAQLLPWCRGRSGFLLVLGSGNVDEALRGYMTKYDCSSADINPIGGICKQDLRKLLLWGAETLSDCAVLREIVEAPPSAELQPLDEADAAQYSQTDEEDMGMSYDELGIFGYLRKVQNCGPVTMLRKLSEIRDWRDKLSIAEIAQKVKRFFFYYGINRHKLTTLTPSYHAENYSPDDNRFDFRPFLYNSKWARQFRTMDAMVSDAMQTTTTTTTTRV
jgi:NAD+ synthase (glutamine-hydrolysing)